MSTTILKVVPSSTTLLQRGTASVLRVTQGATIVRAIQGIPGPPGIDVLTTVGDLAGYNGATARFPVGADDQILIADSGEAFGFRWGPQPATSPLTTKGDLYTFDVDNQREPVGTDGQFLRANSATATGLQWDTLDAADLPAHASTHNPGGTDALATAIAGAIQPDDTAAEGVAASFARSDHRHAIAAAIAAVLAVGQVAGEGVSTSFARADHVHGVPSAAPGATINAGDAAVEGVATSFVRSDHQHAVATGTPGAIEPDDAAAEGVSTDLARADHTHSIVAAIAAELTDSTNAEGVATSFSRSDHTHAHGNRGGGTLHALVIAAGAAGFMSGADKTKLDGIEAGAQADQTLAEVYAFGSSGVDSTLLLDATRGPLILQDNATPIGNVLQAQSSAAVDFLAVSPTVVAFGTTPQRLFVATNIEGGDPGYGGFEIYPDAFTRTNLVDQAVFSWTSTLTSSRPGGGGIGNENAPNFVSWAGEVILTEQGNLFNTQSLFSQSTTVTCQGANSGPIYTMINQPLLRTGSLGGARTTSQQNAVRSQVRVGPNLAGTHTLLSHEAFFATMILDATGGAASVTTANYFAPKAPTLTGGATVTTLNLANFPNIPAAGITNLRGLFSEMSSGDFIRHEGTAPARFGGVLQLGAGATWDWQISRAAANRADIATGDNLRFVDGTLEFRNANAFVTAGANDDLHISATRIGFNVLPGAVDTWMTLSAPARTASSGGSDIAQCLNSSGGTLTLNAAYTNAGQWIVNAPTIAGSTAPTNAFNMLIQTSVGAGTNRYGLLITSNPSGGTINKALYVVNGEARFDQPLRLGHFTVAGVPSATEAGRMIYVTDETGGAVPAFSDGTDWRRVTDRAIVA